MTSRFKRKKPSNLSNKKPIKKPNNLPVKKSNSNGNGKKKNGSDINRNGNGKLTAKQAKFIDEYLVDLNATQAAIRAGYSKKTAQPISAQLLLKLIIQEAIQKRRLELMATTQMTQEWVLNGYKRLVDYDLDEIHTEDHSLLPLSQMSKNAKFAVCGVKTKKHKSKNITADGKESETESTEHELKFTPKKEILDKVGEHLGMFVTDSKNHGNTFIGQNIQVNLINDNNEVVE